MSFNIVIIFRLVLPLLFLSFLKNYFIIVQLQLSEFSPQPSTPPQPNPPPSLASTLPLSFVHVSFIAVPENPSPHCPFPSPLWLFIHCWDYTLRALKHQSKRTYAPQCSYLLFLSIKFYYNLIFQAMWGSSMYRMKSKKHLPPHVLTDWSERPG